MANHESSKKRARSSLVKNERNRQYLSAVRTAIKKFNLVLNTVRSGASTDSSQLNTLFSEAQSLLGRAASKGILHKNNAARRIARLAHGMKNVATPNTSALKSLAKKTSNNKKAPAAKAKAAAAPKTTAAAKTKATTKPAAKAKK